MFLEYLDENMNVSLLGIGCINSVYIEQGLGEERVFVYASMKGGDDLPICMGKMIECIAYMDKLKCALAERGELISKP